MKFKALSAFDSRTFMYRFYRLFPQWKEFETKKMKDFTNIVKEFHQDLKEAATERYGVELPLNMGKLMVISYKSRRNYPRFSGYSDTSPTMHMNHGTDGLKCKIVFTNYEPRYRVKDRHIWSFAPEAGFRQMASQAFLADHTKYIFSPDKTEFNGRKIEMETRDAIKAKIEKFLLTYDEFDFA